MENNFYKISDIAKILGKNKETIRQKIKQLNLNYHHRMKQTFYYDDKVLETLKNKFSYKINKLYNWKKTKNI